MSINPDLAPKDDETDVDLARAWIERQKISTDTPEWNLLFWTWERFDFLTENLPDKAWTVIKLIVSMDHSTAIIEGVLAGPIDELIRNFGIEMIDLMESDIASLPELKPLLAYRQLLNGRKASWVSSEFHGRAKDGSIGQELAPKDNEADEDFARSWIEFQKTERNSEKYNLLFWTFERINYLIDHLPTKAFRIILLIWSIDQSIETIQSLSTGPVEDLLVKHGSEMILFVEAEAKRDPSFAKMLGGVWKSGMTDEVWNRLQAVWDRRGWDGIPEESAN